MQCPRIRRVPARLPALWRAIGVRGAVALAAFTMAPLTAADPLLLATDLAAVLPSMPKIGNRLRDLRERGFLRSQARGKYEVA